MTFSYLVLDAVYVCAYCMEMFMERNCGDHNNNVVHVGSICLMLGILFLLRNAVCNGLMWLFQNE